MDEKGRSPFAFKVIQNTESGPLVWGTFDTEEELMKFMKYLVKSAKTESLKEFRVREIYLDFTDEDFLAYAAFLGVVGKGGEA